MLDYIRIACAVPKVRVGDIEQNTKDICSAMVEADAREADLLVLPELALTGYTCGDLFFQQTLHEAVREGLRKIIDCSADHMGVTLVFGLPYLIDGQLYNCAAVVSGGILRGLVPKTFLANYNGFQEKRWFASAEHLCDAPIDSESLGLEGEYSVPLSTQVIYKLGDGVKLGVEVCEDLWSPIAPSAGLALGGAHIIVNPAASNELIGKRSFRRETVKHQSAACLCAYAFCSAGATESTQDTVFSGHSVIAQGGRILAENKKLIEAGYMITADVDVGMLRADRQKVNTFRDASNAYGRQYAVEVWDCSDLPLRADGSCHPISKLPFVPDTDTQRNERCLSAFEIQVAGLMRRLDTIHASAVIGVSGGLDSTLALLVAVEAMRRLGRPLSDVHGITMPCFGTSDRTYQNAWELMRNLGISSKEISIRDAVVTHFRDIGHDPSVHDATYENSQARERTQILMDYASRVGGIVVGTGDLSELALGWCTYNGDHMSMYSVNGSVPKTMIRWIIDAVVQLPQYTHCAAVLKDILDTPISPELLPPDDRGKIAQQTEDIVGPYALHDFFLYYMLRYGFAPKKVYQMACRAFRDDFPPETVKKWLQKFYWRFFSQQFKRDCQPDGVKIGTVSVGARGDLCMPSDAVAALWTDEAAEL